MAKIKHISGYEFDEEKLNAIYETFRQDCLESGIPINGDIKHETIMASVMGERETLKTLGIQIPADKIKAEFKKIPWWKRLFMFSKQKKLERAKITLDLITRKRNDQ